MRNRSFLSSLPAFLVLLVFVLPAWGEASTVFGPACFARGWGKPQTAVSRFQGPGTGSRFLLWVRNGDHRGARRVSTGRIALNGKSVVGPRDFKSPFPWMGKVVSLEASNFLEVTLGGAPGGFITVTVFGRENHPAVEFSASPAAVASGGQAVLTWRTSNADTCQLEPGFGSVPPKGSATVTPSRTTTYTLTAWGAGGTATATATVTVLNGDPIAADDRASTREGVPVSVDVLANDRDPDGDPIYVTGFRQGTSGSVVEGGPGMLVYTPSAGFTGEDGFDYTVEDGRSGRASGRVTVTVEAGPPISLRVISPLEGERIEGPHVMVWGTVVNRAGEETGVTVNGVMAEVYGEVFVAGHVPLHEGENRILAIAGDAAGNTASSALHVFSERTGEAVVLHAVGTSGVPPFETSLRVDAPFAFTRPVFSCAGPGEVEIREGDAPDVRWVKVSTEGIHTCTVTLTDPRGVARSDAVALVGLNRDVLDRLLRNKWNAMKGGLAAGAVEEALGFFGERSRSRYRMIFDELGPGLADIAARMEEIELIRCYDHEAEYRISRTHRINGNPVAVTYSIFFAMDEEGLWKIDRF